MTANHARASAVARLLEAVAPVQLKRHDALKILADERCDILVDIINEYAGVTTHADAVHVVNTDPRYRTLCETCGWTVAMICPECAEGCGCAADCWGWRHGEYSGFDDEDSEPDSESYYPYDEDEDPEDSPEPDGYDPADPDDFNADEYRKETGEDPCAEEPPDAEGRHEWSGANAGSWGGSLTARSDEPPF